MVYKVLTDPSTHRATGVMYIDRVTREVREVRARAVLLCAQALESARILFNSAEGGLANSSGVLGHYLMDHTWVAGGARGEFPDAPAPKPSLGAPRRPNGLYTIRMKNTINGPREKKYLRGFGFQGGGSTTFRMNAPGYGAAFKKGVLDPLTTINLVGFGEVLPRFDNFVALDPKVVDKFGIPVLRITMTWGENEKAMIPDMAVAATQMLEAAGARNIEPFTRLDRIPGYGIHEMGTARMGRDPKTSVLNGFLRTHDIDNLYVMDASSFVSGGCQNPTLDDHGARRARLRSPDGRDEAGQHLAMVKHRLLSSLGVLAVVCVAAGCNSKPKPVSADTWATVDGRSITRDDVEKTFRRTQDAAATLSPEEAMTAQVEHPQRDDPAGHPPREGPARSRSTCRPASSMRPTRSGRRT